MNNNNRLSAQCATDNAQRATRNGSVLIFFVVLCALCIVPGSVLCAGDLATEDRAAASVERRQKIEIGKFYNAQGGRAPMLPMAIGLYNDAVKFFEKNEYGLARQAVKDSLELDARNALAWELWGEIEYLQQDFTKALEHYKKSYVLNPSPRLRQKIEKAEKENAVEKDLATYDEEHFIIKYRQGDKGYDGYGLKDLLRETYRQISQDFGHYFQHKTVVLFYDKDQFHDVTEQSQWVGGLYDGKIRLPTFRKDLIESDLRATVAHEMTHAFVASLSGMRAPAWLHEGLAQYEENRIRPINLTVFNAAVKTKTLLPVSQIISDKMPTQKKDPLLVALFYQQSYQLVSYMIERYQLYRMKEVLAKFKEGKTAEEAISEVLSISPQKLEADWLATL